MIEIVEPPNQDACSTCGALIWLWSPRREAWVCFVIQPERDVLKLHACKHAQNYATWRDLPRRNEPPEEYVEARRVLATQDQKIIEEE